MSLTSPVPDPISGIVHTALGQKCFFCGHCCSDPAIVWCGETAEIYLHPRCVPDLTIRLYRDLHEHDRPDYYRRVAKQRRPDEL
jgi:hypothetical protein